MTKGQNQRLKVIVSGGGTGGHIFPAIAIADEIRRRNPDAEILFVGARDKMEMQKVPQAGYPIKGLWIAGIQRKITVDNLLFPVKLMKSLFDSYRIVKSFKPDVCIGTGGFASGPLLRAAAFAGVPTVLQEQNSFPGITNKWLAKYAAVICVAYDKLERFFPKEKIRLTGNPVRQSLVNISEKTSQKIFDNNKPTLLVLGGSLGAFAVNKLIEKQLPLFKSLDINVYWQCGKNYEATYTKYNTNGIKVSAFIESMETAYAQADIIISRAGASSVSELCLVGKPVIFIPSPNVAEDHQTKNAQSLVDKHAALMLRESELETAFESTFTQLFSDSALQLQLSDHIKQLAKPSATQDIVDLIFEILQKK
jgi:UDP-N-acetylglucosamine--N-acetylmuramyl-(pentapeptide) pyrophosphoryl-undecaprenol N-acetylglucosamine transferase